jgi:hypothetical protein
MRLRDMSIGIKLLGMAGLLLLLMGLMGWQGLHGSAVKIQKVLAENGSNRMTTAASLQEIDQKNSVPALAAVRGSLHDISGLFDIQVEKQENQLHEIESKTKRNILLLTRIALVIGAGVSFLISRLLSGQIREDATLIICQSFFFSHRTFRERIMDKPVRGKNLVRLSF